MAFFRPTPKLRLLATAAPLGLMAIASAAPAYAQTTPTPAPASTDTQASDNQGGDIVVTGTLFRRTDKETPSPVTTLTADDLDKRGINTVQDAVQKLSANGAGALPNSFSANGAFASGASAASLRGLTTSSTLVLFDGMRAAYYPLADDGTRNFVDLNSIPSGIIERIDVLKDGASSTYGADAVAGVINIITKKEVKGLYLTGSAGISDHGDLGEQRLTAMYGYGDLDEQGFNIYVSGEYQHDAALYSRDRGYPYNTADLSKLCGTSVGAGTPGAQGYIAPGTTTCRTNSIQNGVQFDGTFSGGTTTVAEVRPYNGSSTTLPLTAGGSTTYAPNTLLLGQYQLLGTGCGNLGSVTLTAAQRGSVTNNTGIGGTNGYTGSTYTQTLCQQDNRNLWSVIAPEQKRIGASARATFKLGDTTEAYAMFNYYRSDVYYTGTPQLVRANAPAGGPTFTTANIALPVYVCNRNGASAVLVNNVPTVAGCTAANGTLNPNNPFAASGQAARLFYQLADVPLSNERLTQSYRGALGIKGSFSGFDWNLEGTGMQENLKATYKGYIYIQHMLDEIADGSYNFVNPSANSQAVRDYLAPTEVNTSKSKLYQVQANVSKALFDLPGGPFQVAVGGSYRYEEVDAPSANPVVGDGSAANPYRPTERYFTINGFGTSGKRHVWSAYFEANAPILPQLEVNVSGRYDNYSSGQSNFSPKIGAKFTPIKEIAIRGTFSKGFRIPSFAEAYGLPTTGYITQTPPTNYQASPACINGAGKFAYCTANYSVGLTSVGNPNLKPEKSTNFTAGVIVEPIRNVSLSVDYYNIYKKDLITGADYSPQIAAYYASATAAGTALAPGITGITQDPNYIAGQGPYPLLSTIQYGFINADSAKSTGIDIDLETKVRISPGLQWISSLDANYVIELSQTIGGKKQRYDGTLGPYQTTSASGTPKWKGSWSNTLDFGKFQFTATAYYTAGYELGAEDDGNVRGVCKAGGSYALYRDGTTVVLCRTNSFIDVDLTANLEVNDHFTIYANMLNAFGASPPYDPSTYGAYQYNPAWANAGIVGRYFRVGAKVHF